MRESDTQYRAMTAIRAPSLVAICAVESGYRVYCDEVSSCNRPSNNIASNVAGYRLWRSRVSRVRPLWPFVVVRSRRVFGPNLDRDLSSGVLGLLNWMQTRNSMRIRITATYNLKPSREKEGKCRRVSQYRNGLHAFTTRRVSFVYSSRFRGEGT